MRGVQRRAGPQGSVVKSLTLHFYKKLFPQLEPVTSWSHEAILPVTPRLPFQDNKSESNHKIEMSFL
ncbi:hypothetical protein R3W88_028070 [Solanum pinnatisectum]|uniref:Uncharacterized protein n=1 Tax=Solanum pinnatisectum TaxID=50273 RepID=A0AAV9LHV9_9SOLN|nr:hypothetical protein R3W88_028070 [Solanum pinnatisectum]